MTSSLRQAGFLLLAACVPALAAALWTRPHWRDDVVQKGEIALDVSLHQQPAPLWIDASPAADYASRHIPGALSLNSDRWVELLPAVLQKWEPGQTAIVYASARTRRASREVAGRLEEFKVGPVYVLKGGWEAWRRR